MAFEDEYGGNELDPKMWDSDNDWLLCYNISNRLYKLISNIHIY